MDNNEQDIFERGFQDLVAGAQKQGEEEDYKKERELLKCVLNLSPVSKDLYESQVTLDGIDTSVLVHIPTVRVKYLGRRCRPTWLTRCDWIDYNKCEISGGFERVADVDIDYTDKVREVIDLCSRARSILADIVDLEEEQSNDDDLDL